MYMCRVCVYICVCDAYMNVCGVCLSYVETGSSFLKLAGLMTCGTHCGKRASFVFAGCSALDRSHGVGGQSQRKGGFFA